MNERAVGVFGGTFDPIHAAHLRMARALRDELQLTEVRLIPAGNPYHRSVSPGASAEHRLAMVKLAIEGEPGMVADDREIRRERPAYTVETLESLRADLGPDVPLWCLIGADAFAGLTRWYRWRELFKLAHLAVAMRPGSTFSTLPDLLRQEWETRQVSDFPNRTPSGTIRALTLPPVELSATELREKLAAGDPVNGLLAPPVADYIQRHGLYRSRR
jgi:nicotinate-nucleotide adenylyltransferase